MDHRVAARIDAAVHVTALLVRLAAYALVTAFASRYECGQAILTGLLVGDLAASVAGLALSRGELPARLAEIALLGLIVLWVRADLYWPADQASRAILGLAALGVFAPRTGGAALTRLGPSADGIA